MIVKCEQCQTRFKIPDEKVTEKGVKVRCTKCSHTFRVAKESAATATGAPAAPVSSAPLSADTDFDPFARFGTAPEPRGQVTRPGFFAEGVEASRPGPVALPPPPAPWNSADSGVEEDLHHETTRVVPLPVPPEARPPVPALPPLKAMPGGATPRPGQGLPGPGATFRPQPSGPLPGIPSVAPSVAPAQARGLPTPPPMSPAAQKPAAPPRPAGPGVAGPGSSPRPAVKALEAVPMPAPPPPAADLFTEFFVQPQGPVPSTPLPDLPPPSFPGMQPAAAPPAPAAARPAPAPAAARPAPVSHPFGPPDADPFGSVGVDLNEPPSDLGPALDFDPVPPSFAPPVAAAPPVAPPAARRPPSGRHPSVPAPAAQPPLAVGRPPPAALQVGRPPTGVVPSRLAPSASAPPSALPPTRLPPSPLAPSSLAPPPAPVASAPASASPFADEDPFGAVNMDLSEPPPDLGPPPDFGPPPMFDAPAPDPVAAPPPAPAAPTSAMPFMDEDPFGSSGVELGGQPPGPAGNFSAPAPMPPPQPAAGMPDSFAPPGPMDFGMLGDEQMPPGPATSAAPAGMDDPFAPPEPAGGMPDPFAPPAGMDDPFAPPAGGMPDPFAPPGPAAGMADPFAPPAPAGGMPDPFAPPAGMADPFAAQASGQDPFAAQASGQDPFAAQAPGAGMDPFATAEPAFSPTATGRQRIGSGSPSEGFLTQTDTSHQTISSTDTGRSMFDMPDRSAGQFPPGEEHAAPAGTRELIDLPSQPEEPPPVAQAPSLAAPPIARPAGRPADMGIPERKRPSAAQQVTGQVAYLTIAAGLLLALTAVGGVYMKEGRVDASALSPATFVKLMAPKQLVMRNVTNGLYDTRAGTSLFYVRGEVENRDSKPVRVRVRAALYEGGQRVSSVEGLAGMVPTPEDLHGLTSPEATAQLRTRLDAGVVDIAPGAKAPFTLVFHEYPQDLSAYRLKVTLEPASEEGSKP